MSIWNSIALRIGAAILAVAMPLGANAAEDYDWKFVGGLPMTHDYPQLLDKAFDRIRERTDGRLDIQYVFIAETPYKLGEVITALRDGLIEAGEWVPSFIAGTYPILAGPELPFLFLKRVSVSEGQEATNAAWESPAMDAAVSKIFSDHNVQSFGARYYFEPMNFWFVKREEPSLDTFKDKKMRVFTPELSQLMLGLGANPVTMQSHEVYAALQRNLLDGLVTGSGNVKGSKFHEVLKAGLVADPVYISSWPIVSRSKFEALPEDLQQVLTEEIRATVKEIADSLEARDREKREEAADKFNFAMRTVTQDEYAKLRAIAEERVWPSWKERAGEDADAVLSDVLQAMK